MGRIRVCRDMAVPRHLAWEAIADLGSHAEWMADAERVDLTGPLTGGVGTTLEVVTRVGPLRTVDVLEVTGWEEGRAIEVAHRGLVTGSGRLAVEPREGRTRVTWVEDLSFPWWLGGPVAAWLARPLLASIWQRNLRRLEERLTSP